MIFIFLTIILTLEFQNKKNGENIKTEIHRMVWHKKMENHQITMKDGYKRKFMRR